MNESQIQRLIENQTTSVVPDTSTLFQSMLEPLLPLLSLLLIVSVGLSIIVVIYFIINIIQKQRQHKAILRIDRNLQKLVDAQLPESISNSATE